MGTVSENGSAMGGLAFFAVGGRLFFAFWAGFLGGATAPFRAGFLGAVLFRTGSFLREIDVFGFAVTAFFATDFFETTGVFFFAVDFFDVGFFAAAF